MKRLTLTIYGTEIGPGAYSRFDVPGLPYREVRILCSDPRLWGEKV